MSSSSKLPFASSSTPSASNTGRPGLLRTASRQSSIHAQTSLQRMSTHETGSLPARQLESGHLGNETHHEHDDEDRHGESSSSASSNGSHDHETGETGLGSNEKDLEAQDKEISPGQRKKLELQDQTNLLPVKQVILVFVGLSMALFCSLLDQTIVTTALPTLGQAFGRADIASWVGTSYLLTSTAMQPLYGRLSDIFGRKPTLLAACIIFFLGSLACSVSASMIQLIVFRAIQGIGGGGILTLSMIIVSDIVTLKERGKYQGIIGMVIATANSLGPLIGGLLTEKATWRWCFYLSLPLTAVAFAVIVFLLPLRSVHGDVLTKLRAIDWFGSALTLIWATLFLIGLSWAGSQYAWSSPAVLVPIILGLALLVLFLFVERKVRLPVIPLYIFKTPTVSASMACTFFSGFAFYCTLYYLPTYLQVVHGASPIRSGVLTLPLAAMQTTTAFVAGYITSKTGDYWYNLVIGFGIWTIGLGLMTTLSPFTPESHFVGFQIVTAVGAGQTFQTSLLAIQAAVERKDMATATGTRNFMRMLGGTVGLAACGSVVNNVVRSQLNGFGIGENVVQSVLKDPTVQASWQGGVTVEQVREAYARGISTTFYLMLPMTAVSLLLVLFFVKKISLKRDDDAAKKQEGKEWIENRRRKRGTKGQSQQEGSGSGQINSNDNTIRENQDHVVHDQTAENRNENTGIVEKIEEKVKAEGRVMEEAAEMVDEAAGVEPMSRGGKIEIGGVGERR